MAFIAIPFIAIFIGCTEIQITAPQGELVIANSLEAGWEKIPLVLTPALRGSLHGGHSAGCMEFAAKYGFIGGVSEVGVAINEHALDLAVFQDPQPGIPSLCTSDVASWILGTMGSVNELRTAIATVKVVVGADGWGGGQWGVSDATGDSVVVEFVKGVPTLHNNTVGVDNSGIGLMTNDPTWDWHLQNLNNYAALQPGWYGGSTNNEDIRRKVPAEKAYPWAHNAYDTNPPMVPQPIGHAYNLLGLPGDGSPPSRFVRAFYLRGYALLNAPPADLNATMVLAQELLNSVYKVLGTVARRDAADPMETTPISSIKVLSPTKKWVFYRSRGDMAWRLLDLGRINFNKTAVPPKSVEVTTSGFNFIDVTDRLL